MSETAVADAVAGGRPGKGTKRWTRYLYRVVAAEASRITKYCDRLVQLMPAAHDRGFVLDAMECGEKSIAPTIDELPDLTSERDRRTAVLLNGTFNYHLDIERLLADVRPRLSRTSRLVVVLYNPYLRWLHALADMLGVREAPPIQTFVTRADLEGLARLSGYEVVRLRPVGYVPFRLLGLGHLVNWWMPTIPLLQWLSFVVVATLRPVVPETRRPSLSIVVPARNEKGNIEGALRRMPELGAAHLEIVFVEGHSTDGTWEEIRRVAAAWGDRCDVKTLQQDGTGKCDAVRLGLAHATGDVFAILDADLTMPPELLGRFFDAYCEGRADFVNGNRLLYPMEGEAMRFLNRAGNAFFAKALSYVLGNRVTDSLCGTKLFARHDYARFVAWRRDFGDFDPFGDYELLFPASVLALGIVDVPIRYRARTYGTTNIRRFRHGLLLLRMTLVGLFRVRVGPWKLGPRPRTDR